ncbi:MAG: DUF3800 domain-containing protein [Candidatus Hydrogenedentes bacterium]|nr:DUF3800 domain-containing protein [Candidatus Hydrogenedentota bacterium]
MYIMYVDESGDPGLVGSPSTCFALSGLIVHEQDWQSTLALFVALRRRLRVQYGLRLRDEIHAARMINKPPKSYALIARNDRLAIVRAVCDELARIPKIDIINVIVDKNRKSPGYDVFTHGWEALIQRFENTITAGNFRGSRNLPEKGIVVCDHTDELKLRNLLRRMRRYNPVPNQQHYGTGSRNLQIVNLIEDPIMRDSKHSYFIQACDVAAYVLYQFQNPCRYMRKTGGAKYFTRLQPILCRFASPSVPFGVVRL